MCNCIFHSWFSFTSDRFYRSLHSGQTIAVTKGSNFRDFKNLPCNRGWPPNTRLICWDLSPSWLKLWYEISWYPMSKSFKLHFKLARQWLFDIYEPIAINYSQQLRLLLSSLFSLSFPRSSFTALLLTSLRPSKKGLPAVYAPRYRTPVTWDAKAEHILISRVTRNVE